MAKNGRNKASKKWQFKMHFSIKDLVIWGLVGLFLLSLFSIPAVPSALGPEIPLSLALADIKKGSIANIDVIGDRLIITYKDQKKAIAHKETTESLVKTLETAGINPSDVTISIRDNVGLMGIVNSLGNIFSLVFLLITAFFLISFFRQGRGMGQSLFSFGASRAKLFTKDMPQINFGDVAGVDEAKKELEEVVDFLKNPKKYRLLGARTPKGVLLIGPSGAGKTLLARAVAGEAKVPFFSMAGSEFMEMLVGVGASVTGDTPILIREEGQVKLLPIGEFVDKYYKLRISPRLTSADLSRISDRSLVAERSAALKDEEERRIIPIKGVETLGFQKKMTKFWGTQKNSGKSVFGRSMWQEVFGVYRHQVKEIYTIYYLGGKIETTGDHSVFVRTQGWIEAKKVNELKTGDILVSLPMNVRRWDYRKRKTVHEIKAYQFNDKFVSHYLPVWDDDEELKKRYDYAISQTGVMPQWQVAAYIGVSQATVGNWQREIHLPQLLSRKLVKMELPDKVKVVPGLMKLFGFYTAEGRGTNNLEFTFGIDEKEIYTDCINLIKEIFGVSPSKVYPTEDNSFKIIYYCHQLGRFFERYCGNGAHNKHLPSFVWDLPREYYLAYLDGLRLGDGYITKSGKLSITSVSKQLILELSWLSSMHGVKVGIKHGKQKGGRIIKNKPLPDGEYWSLIIGKTSNPFFKKKQDYPYQIKRAIIKKIIKRPYDSYVYDLCGVENEAFFGGEKPILLHNSRVRDLFQNAKKSSPSIIFIDEIDAIGRVRSLGAMGGHDEREQTLNQILVEMDGFEPNTTVLVIAATNRGDLLDPALMRPGRFDRRIVLELPDMEGREKILEIHKRGKPFASGINWSKVVKRTVGFSGADLENMLNEAAILAARNNRSQITFEDIEEAATKVKLGPEKKRLQSDLDRKITAYHEAGHALVTFHQPHMDKVHRISIVSRGHALGFTLIPPETDRLHESKTHLLEEIVTMLGGRAAEELVFDEMTTGAANDIVQATEVAREMVTKFGMSSLGPINFGPHVDVLEYGRSFYEPVNVSQNMQEKIDDEIQKILQQAYLKAQKILKDNLPKLHILAQKLIEVETIESEDFEKLMKSEKN